MEELFESRGAAGVTLAQLLKQYRNHAVAMAVGANGVSVAAEVARLLYLPLGIVPVVKLRGPTGVIFGALAPGGAAVVDWRSVTVVGENAARAIAVREQAELARLEKIYRELAALPVARRTVILIADAMDTGMSVRAALRALRLGHPARVIAAAPVVTARACGDVRADGCECVCLVSVASNHPVGAWYREVHEPHDCEALGQLQRLARHARFTVA